MNSNSRSCALLASMGCQDSLRLRSRLDDLIRKGKAHNFAKLADAGHVSCARLTQIMNLLNLALDTQKMILAAVPDNNFVKLTERELRSVITQNSWKAQSISSAAIEWLHCT